MELHFKDRTSWREWLKKNHSVSKEVWLVFYKKHTGRTNITYDAAVEEALCFGWIDSILKRLDDDRYARKFTPRKVNSVWSPSNRRRYENLRARGKVAAPGLRRAPTPDSGTEKKPPESRLPSYIEKRLKTVPRAWENFKQLAPSYRRAYVGWIDSARREETRERRLREALELLAAGKKLGLK